MAFSKPMSLTRSRRPFGRCWTKFGNASMNKLRFEEKSKGRLPNSYD